MKEFIPFLVFFILLMALLMFDSKKPWIILTAFLGCVYGAVTNHLAKDLRPELLHDRYPNLKNTTTLVDFGYLDPKKNMKVTWQSVVGGSLKVAFVAVLETLISARIADGMTCTRFD